ncbi:hypothetical protein GGR50DRAFT_489408 [Xylaria sp. CBS 124048]|nr:hypothetical protein GGR50DRAFT_489408 [Xylaria sp. CBS 124048]
MTHPDQLHAGEEDKDKLIQILSLFLLLLGILTVCTRLGTKYVLKRSFRLDDKLIVIAEVILIAQTVAVILSASQGLGKPEKSLSEQAVDNTLKAEYASIPLLIAGFAVIKWSLLELVYHVSPNHGYQRTSLVIAGLVGLWLVTTIFTSLFQCALPAPWDHGPERPCINRKAWWTYVTTINVVTEFSIIALYISIFAPLQMSSLKKTAVLAVFSTRFLVAVAAILQLITFHLEDMASDMTYSLWLPTLSNQITAAVSIVTACIPYLKPFMDSVELDIIRIQEAYTLGDSDFERRPGDGIFVLQEVNISSVDCDCRSP